jgi:hypothetical protein
MNLFDVLGELGEDSGISDEELVQHLNQIMSDTRKGGRGKCIYCGEFHNNVAYHRAFDCSKRPDAQKIQELNSVLKNILEPSFRCKLLVNTHIDGKVSRTIEFSLRGDPNNNEDLYKGLKEVAEMNLAPVGIDDELFPNLNPQV